MQMNAWPHGTRPTTSRRPCLGAALLGSCLAAAAQSPPDGLWHGDVSVGGSVASGNTSATTVNLRADSSRATEVDKIGLSVLVNYGRSKAEGITTRSADLARGGGRYDRNLDERLFAFGGGEAETNRPGGVSSRLNVNAGVGRHMLQNDESAWDLFAGVGHAETRFTDGSRRAGVEWLFGEESTHKLGASTSFKQRLVLYPGGDEIGDRATFDASLAAAIVGGWTFNTGLALRHTNQVPPGTPKTERLLTFGFGYKF
jgi:putative salt-induced outer membrane protein